MKWYSPASSTNSHRLVPKWFGVKKKMGAFNLYCHGQLSRPVFYLFLSAYSIHKPKDKTHGETPARAHAFILLIGFWLERVFCLDLGQLKTSRHCNTTRLGLNTEWKGGRRGHCKPESYTTSLWMNTRLWWIATVAITVWSRGTAVSKFVCQRASVAH